ncbi:MAG: O-antigen ligase family protein [Verrucomicrobium sp.]|nr:O-antigen ligase family protein [Verrucomicrobium sp.]
MVSRFLAFIVVALFLLGLLATGVLGTETRLLFFWPGCFLVGLSGLLAALRWRWRLRFIPSDLCLTSVLVFTAYMLVRQVTSPVEAHAREDLFILLGCFVTYTLSATVISHPASRLWALGCLLLLTLGNLAVGFIHFSGKWSFHVVPSYMRSFGEENRIGGFYNNPNHMAAFLAMMALVLAGMAVFGRGGAAKKLWLGFVSLAAGIGVALAISRGALLGLAFGGLVLAVVSMLILWKTYPHLVFKLLIALSVLSVMGGLVLYGVFSEQLQRRFGMTQIQQGDPRIQIWKAALAQNAEHPIVGAGARMFYEGCITYRQPATPIWLQEAEFVHNEWLQLFADYGGVGVLLLLFLLIVHFYNAVGFLKWFATEKFDRTATLLSNGLGLTVGASAALIACMVHAFVEFHLHIAAPALTAAYLLGILANPGFSPEGRKPVRVPGSRPILKLALMAAGIWMLYGTWMYGRADYYAEKADVLAGRDDPESLMDRLEWLSKSISIDDHNANTWHLRGLLRLNAAAGMPADQAKGFLKRAVVDLERAHQLNPYSMFPALALADAQDALQHPDEARRAIDAALVVAPIYEMPRLALALHLHRLQRWQEAEEAYLWAGQALAGKQGDTHRLYLRMLRDAERAR